jgi:hypothetical protein
MSEVDSKKVAELLAIAELVADYNADIASNLQVKLQVPDDSPMREHLKTVANGGGIVLTGGYQMGKGLLGAVFDGASKAKGKLGTAKDGVSKLGDWLTARGAQPISGNTKDDSKDS